MKKKLLIFTDLDGTLLDSNYSFSGAKLALKLIQKKNIPLILCSSKTRAEIEHYRKKLRNEHPFVSENGGGIFIPKRYFRFQISNLKPQISDFKFQISNLKFQIEKERKYYLVKLGAVYSDLRRALGELNSEDYNVVGFGDMSVKEVAELTGLKKTEAIMAKKRDFDEPFIITPKPFLLKGGKRRFSSPIFVKELKKRIKAKGFRYTQGDFFHLMGDSDKGKAVKILKVLYTKQDKNIITVAFGDSPNDIEMLKEVDYPVVVKKTDGNYSSQIIREVKRCSKADGIGPEGWNKAVIRLLKTLFR